MPSAPVRFAIEAAFLALVALGAGLARLEPVAIVALIVVACVLVALAERANARESARAAERSEATGEEQAVVAPEASGDVEAGGALPPQEDEPQPEPDRQPELAVSERSARAILASGPPSALEPPAREPELPPEPEPETAPEPPPEPVFEPEPERVSVASPEPEEELPHGGPRREWSVWELERLVRERRDDPRQEEWAALVLSLRDFARVDGMLPLEFDQLVRESFGPLLAGGGTRTEAAAAS